MRGAGGEGGEEISWKALVEQADRALYGSKEAGRNRVTLFASSPVS